MQRGTPQALRLLAANRQGRPPQRPVERMHLMQLLLELHRQAYERTGGEPSFPLPELQGQSGSAAFVRDMQRRLLYRKESMAFCTKGLHRRNARSRMGPNGAVLCCSCAVAAADAATSTAAWR